MAEEYGEDLAGVRVHPPSVDFFDVERGVKYVIRVAVKNVSHRAERVRFVAPPAGSGFTVLKHSTATIAPGIEAHAEVEFVLAADEDYHSTLKVDVSGKVVELPLHAYRPRAQLELETVLSFGPVVHENVVSRLLRVANRGKRAAKVAFEVAMIEAGGEEVPQAQLGERSLFTIVPETCEIGPGEERELAVELDARALGPARGLARLSISGGVGPSLVDLSGNVLMQRVELLDAKGVLAPPRLSFGQLYAGLERKQTCTLVNNGPSSIAFSFASLGGDEEPQELAEDEELDRELSDAVFSISPADGRIGPFESLQLSFAFKPPPSPPSKAGFRATRAEEGGGGPPHFAVCKRLSVLETSQQIDLILSGVSVAPSVTLSRATIQFAQPCKLHDHQDALVTVANGNLEMAVDFSVDKLSNFAVTPASGRLAPGASRELMVTFAPKQQGAVQKTLAVKLFKGAVHSLPLHVSGVCQGTNGRRRMVGGPLALPEDFAHEMQLALTGARPLGGGITTLALTQPVGDLAGTSKKSSWEQSEELDETLTGGMGGLAKKRTFDEQMSLQKALDRKQAHHTGFELSARELAHLSGHRERYSGYLRTAHAERTAREQSKFVKPAVRGLGAFESGVDMGMASLSTRGAHPLEGGWSSYEPRLALPRAKDPLWLEHPYDIDGNVPLDGGKGSKSKGLLFDDRKLIKRKHKPAPSTAEEVTQCNMSLLPKDLLQVTGGPKVVNFGTISVYTLVHRSFNIANDLLTNVLVTVDAHDELELRQSTPTSQVVPPSGISGFDLLFSSSEVGPFKKTISYSINDRYSYKFTVIAEVVPIDVELSVDELDFAFQPTDLNPNITLSVILKNRGTYKADYEAKGPATTAKRPAAFVVEPAIATVEAGKSKEVLVTFTPTAGAVLDHMLTFIVEGGPSRTLLCKAEYEEPKCTVEPKRCEFGLISVGIPKELSLTVKNSGNEPTVIYWDKPLLGLEMSPLLCTLPANGSVEFTLTLDARAPLKLDAPLSAHVRGGKAIKVHISADAQLPHVSVLQDEFDFGTVTVGARETRELTLVNTGQLTAGLDLHLTQHAGFEVLYSPPPKSVAQLDEGAEEGDVEQVLQLLSAIADDTGAATARGRPQSAVSERRDSAPLVGERDYRITVPAGGSLTLQLRFAPVEAGEVFVELPLSLVGLAVSPALRRAVSARAISARIVVSPRHVDLSSCVLRSADYPYSAEFTVSNVDPSRKPLRWELDTSALPVGGLLEIGKDKGLLGTGETETVSVVFRAEAPVALEKLFVPVYLDGDRSKPYVVIEISARGVRPRLRFDRTEVVLPPVPLGMTSAATFLVLNDGYDNLEVSSKLPADSAKVPIAINFPEGNMLGLGRQRLPVVLSFSSRKPMSFTAKVFMLDVEGRRYGITVSGSADNSVLTMQSWLNSNRGSFEWLDSPGKPVQLNTSSPDLTAKPNRRGSAAKPGAASSSGAASGLPPPPLQPEWPVGVALEEAIAEAEKEAGVLQPWIRSFLLDLPSQRPFPGGLLLAKGRPLIEILETVSGKPVGQLIPREVQAIIARPPNSRLALAKALVKQYDLLLTFLKQHGALLGNVKPEELLSRDDYMRWHAANRRVAAECASDALLRPPPTRASIVATPALNEDGTPVDNDGRPLDAKHSDEERRALLAIHRLASLRAWMAVFYQTIKVFVIARITPRALRTTPGCTELIGKSDEFEAALLGSNCFSATECVLLHWLTLHWRRVAPEKAVGPLARICCLEQLRDGHVLAALLLSHAPFLAASKADGEAAADESELRQGSRLGQGSSLASDGEVDGKAAGKPGSSLALLHPAPCSREQAERNVQLCVDAMGTGLAMERPPSCETFVSGSERSVLLALVGLYQTLPHYVPKTTIQFSGALHEAITKSIELTNPAKRPIHYSVRLEGSDAFELPMGRSVRIEPRSTLAYPVTFASRFAADATARLLLLSRADGVTTAHATSLSFVLDARITSKKPHATLQAESPLYKLTEQEVTVTNPFDVTCAFRIELHETRPPLDLSPSSVGAALANGGAAARGRTGAANAALSLVAGPSSAERAAELERALERLPAAFHVASADPRKPETTLHLKAGASATVRLQFLPFMLGEQSCELSFLDKKAGEFVYLVKGTGTLPLPIETINFRTDANTSSTIQAALPYKNEALEKARADALRRLAKVRDKDLERQREPLRKSPLIFSLEFSGTFFQGPAQVELVQPAERRRGKGGGPPGAGKTDGTRSGWQTPAEGLGDGTATPGNPGTARLPDGATAALVPLVFAPKQAGMYTSKLVLYSPLDVRVFELAGTAPTPGTRATLEFAAPARRSIKQDLPVVNNSSVAWDLQAMVTGACFRGATSLRVVAGGSEVYTLEFAPEWICSVKGELVLTNAATQDRFAYALNGVGEEPLAEGTVLIEVVARSRASHEFALFNVSADGRECECTVESDLMHVSGEPSVHVPARAGPVPFGKQNFFLGKEDLREAARQQSVAWTGSALASSRRGSALGKPPPARYSLSITPQLGGSVHGSITIKTPDGRYLWYTVEIRAAPPPMEKQIEVSAPVRGAAILEVEIANPSREPVQFSVELEGEGLLGAPTLWIGAGPNAVAKYEVMYSPLLAGVSSGAISFLNPTVGEFWYKLLLTGTQPPPEVLPQFSVELGASGSHALLVENPLAEALTLRATSSNARNWSVGTRGGSALTLPPFGSAEVVLRYNPSAIGVEQGSLIQLTHPRLAPWEYSVSGVGTPPSTMVVTEVSSELHTITSASVSFHNPFDAQVVVGVRLDAPDAREGAFALLLRKTQGILVAPGATLQVSFTFHALEMAEHAASISITLEGAQRLTWRYSIVAYAETKPSMKPLSLAIRARQQLQTILELPLLGLEEHGPSGGFAVELQGVPEECARLVTGASMRMQVAGPPSEERLLPIAVQWTPLRPIKAHASLVVRQEGGGRWKFDVILHAGAPEVDDVILLESTLNRTASVSFSLANAFDADAEFSANFTADSPSVFSVTPSRGILPRAGSAGQQLVVSFTPLEYGKNDVGVLVITTAEMQWSYEVRGKPPVFVLPKAKKKIDDKIDPAIERRLQQNKLVSQSKNFLQRNMKL